MNWDGNKEPHLIHVTFMQLRERCVKLWANKWDDAGEMEAEELGEMRARWE